MTCREAEPLLSPLVDGQLEEGVARQVLEHLDGCSECRRARDEYAELLAACRRMDEAPPPASAERGWAAIEAGLEQAERARARRWRLLMWPSVAGAVLLLVVAAGLLVWQRLPPSDAELLRSAEAEFRRAEEHYGRAVADLRRVAARQRATWAEARRREFDAALARHEEEVRASRLASAGQPGDALAQERLFVAYRDEISFLEAALARGLGEEPGP